MLKKYLNSFHFWIAIITIIGFIVRIINVNYSSMWADEIYTMCSVHPTTSWYEVLWWQRAYQPPLYFVILWVWVKVFSYNEFYVRLLSVIVGSLCITTSGYLGRKIKNESIGIAMALIVAFSPLQIWYSLEARFYVFVYLFASMSVLLYWKIIVFKSRNRHIIFIKSIVDAGLLYFHHFGILLIAAQFIFDIYLFYIEKDKQYFMTKIAGYFIAGILYLPWILWGLSEGLAIKQYWLKEIDIKDYFLFSFFYSPRWIQYFASIFIIYFLAYIFYRKKNAYYYYFPLSIFAIIIVPVIFSYIKWPILVNRYSMVMSPLLYLLFLLGLHTFMIPVIRIKQYRDIILYSILALFIFQGIKISFFDKEELLKYPYREMAEWIKSQKGYERINIYSHPVGFKKFNLIDTYLNRSLPTKSILDINVGEDREMYIISANDSLLYEVKSKYNVKEIGFMNNKGFIYDCVRK